MPSNRFPGDVIDISNHPDTALERHYSVEELAKIWGLSRRTIRRIFGDEPGVVRWGNAESRHKRGYITLRIPESVVQRVHRRLRKAS
jgi:AraC-like DNA-binding protein